MATDGSADDATTGRAPIDPGDEEGYEAVPGIDLVDGELLPRAPQDAPDGTDRV